LCIASKAARYLGLVPISDIADHKNPEPHLFVRPQAEPNARFEINTPEFSHPRVWINDGDGYNLASAQPYFMEVWVEKSTMNDFLLPVCEQFAANLVTVEGEMTLTAVYTLLQRMCAANKPARVFYISDFDPAGYSMPCAVARPARYPAVVTIQQLFYFSRYRRDRIDFRTRPNLVREIHRYGGFSMPALSNCISRDQNSSTRQPLSGIDDKIAHCP